jgi:hypothetical protein
MSEVACTVTRVFTSVQRSADTSWSVVVCTSSLFEGARKQLITLDVTAAVLAADHQIDQSVIGDGVDGGHAPTDDRQETKVFLRILLRRSDHSGIIGHPATMQVTPHRSGRSR